MNKQKLTLRATCLCLALCLLTVLVCDLVLPGAESRVYDSFIRLHILANSDSAADQALKLKVRDAILAAEVFGTAKDIAAAESESLAAAKTAVDIANSVLKEAGVTYKASLVYGKERYPTRQYGDIVLPAGTYKSLRIVLGDGDGQNWWCVLFPPLCVGGAKKDTLSASGMESGALRVFETGNTRYRFKFKLLEMFS